MCFAQSTCQKKTVLAQSIKAHMVILQNSITYSSLLQNFTIKTKGYAKLFTINNSTFLYALSWSQKDTLIFKIESIFPLHVYTLHVLLHTYNTTMLCNLNYICIAYPHSSLLDSQ